MSLYHDYPSFGTSMSMMTKLVKGPTAFMGLLVLISIPAQYEISIPFRGDASVPRKQFSGLFIDRSFRVCWERHSKISILCAFAAIWSSVLQCCYKAGPKAAADKFAEIVSRAWYRLRSRRLSRRDDQ